MFWQDNPFSLKVDQNLLTVRFISANAIEPEIMATYLLATNMPVGIAEINLGMACPMRPRIEHFLLPIGHTVGEGRDAGWLRST